MTLFFFITVFVMISAVETSNITHHATFSFIDTVMIDDAPPWTVVGGTAIIRKPPVVVIITSILSLNLLALFK